MPWSENMTKKKKGGDHFLPKLPCFPCNVSLLQSTTQIKHHATYQGHKTNLVNMFIIT